MKPLDFFDTIDFMGENGAPCCGYCAFWDEVEKNRGLCCLNPPIMIRGSDDDVEWVDRVWDYPATDRSEFCSRFMMTEDGMKRFSINAVDE